MIQPDSVFYSPPAWSKGHVSIEDAAFLHETVCELVATVAIEVGVASGCSSAVLLNALAPKGGALYSFDIAESCYFDTTRTVGSAVDELCAEFKSRWNLHTCSTALDAAEMLVGRDVPVAFIDANHYHPWPILDAMALLPAMALDGWLLLHDINLPNMGDGTWARCTGAQQLFAGWPGTKRSCGGCSDNTGAIQLLGNHSKSCAVLRDMLLTPWEVSIPPAVCRKLLGADRGLDPTVYLEGKMDLCKESGRSVVVWGAGRLGRLVLGALARMKVDVVAVIDTDSKKESPDALPPVALPGWLQRRVPNAGRPYVVISSMYASEISLSLASLGFQAGTDFCVADLEAATTAGTAVGSNGRNGNAPRKGGEGSDCFIAGS